MSVAILGVKYDNNDDKVITLENSDLYSIDNITRIFKNEEAFKDSTYYRDKKNAYSLIHNGEDGKIVLTYIKNNEEKIELKLIFGEEEPIRIRTSSLEDVKSETERSRKLLLNSKNQIFLTSFLTNKNLLPTTSATVKMTIDEYKNIKKEGYKVTAQDGEYRISIREVLRYRLEHKKLGPMRLLVEDTLEVWKKNMLRLKDEELYFYSRELRLLLNEYDYRKIPRRAVVNLKFNKSHLNTKIRINKQNSFRVNSTSGLSKRKILEERKAA